MTAPTDPPPGVAARALPADVRARYPHRWAVLDVETTGFSPVRDRVVQVAVTLLDEDGVEQGSWSSLVDPGCDPGPVHVHGITPERLHGAPSFDRVAPTLARLLAGRVLVAHNADFDWGFVSAEMRRAGVGLDVAHRLCTWRMARCLHLDVPDLKLATLAAHWGVPQLQAHDAVDDTRVLVGVLRHGLTASAARRDPLQLQACRPVTTRPLRRLRLALRRLPLRRRATD